MKLHPVPLCSNALQNTQDVEVLPWVQNTQEDFCQLQSQKMYRNMLIAVSTKCYIKELTIGSANMHKVIHEEVHLY